MENGAAKDFDAVAGIEVDEKGRTIGIEYERNPKAASRYRAIREVFQRDETTDAILYLTANEGDSLQGPALSRRNAEFVATLSALPAS